MRTDGAVLSIRVTAARSSAVAIPPPTLRPFNIRAPTLIMEPRISPEIGDDAAFYSDIGRSLRIRRKELGLSLRVVAASVGMSPPMVLKYEAGAKVSSATLVQLAAALDCLPSEFLNVPDPYEQPMIRRLVSAWSRLPNDEARTATIRLIETLSSDAASPTTIV